MISQTAALVVLIADFALTGIACGALAMKLHLNRKKTQPIEDLFVGMAREIRFQQKFFETDSRFRAARKADLRVDGCWYDVRISASERIDA